MPENRSAMPSNDDGIYNLIHDQVDTLEADGTRETQYTIHRPDKISATGSIIADERAFLNKASWWSCYMSLTSTIIGAGILGLPYAFAQTGYILGSWLVILCGIFSFLGLHYLSICARKTSAPASFYSVAESTIPRFTYLIDFAVFAKCYGVSISYLIVIGDLMPAAMTQLNADEMWLSRTPWILIAFGIVAPLTSLQSLDALKWTSSMSIAFVFFLVFLVVLYAQHLPMLDPCSDIPADQLCRGSVSFVTADNNVLKVLSIFIFGYTCQHNTFAVTNELRDPSQRRLDSVFAASIGTAVVLYFIVAVAGYSTYGNLVSADLLKRYPSTKHCT